VLISIRVNKVFAAWETSHGTFFSWPGLDTGVAVLSPPSKDSYKKFKRFIHSTVNSLLKRHTRA